MLSRFIRSVVVLGALFSASSVHATPVRYDFVRGSASVRLVQNKTVLGADSAAIIGTFVSFDDATPALTDLEWIVDDPAVVLGPLGSIDVFLTATDGAGFNAPASLTSPNVWSWTGGPLDVVGSLSFTGGLLNGQTVPVNISLPDLTGTFQTAVVADDTFSLTNAVDIYQFDLFGQHYILQLGVAFKGEAVVPEPSTALLLMTGLVAIARRQQA